MMQNLLSIKRYLIAWCIKMGLCTCDMCKKEHKLVNEYQRSCTRTEVKI